jgi:hypothetical protein
MILIEMLPAIMLSNEDAKELYEKMGRVLAPNADPSDGSHPNPAPEKPS